MQQYDIFVSYRRSSYDSANLIATRLKAAGYTVFFDMETLRSGKFNEQLFDVIDNCKDFLLILPPNALDRCVNEDDWVRLEVCRAKEKGKNIIPVMLNGFSWPDPMPIGMEDLSEYQALTASSIEYFDLAIERLQRQYLLSKPHLFTRKLLKSTGVVIFSLLAVAVTLLVIFRLLSREVCANYASGIAMDASNVHMIATENNAVKENWQEFEEKLSREYRPERIALLQEEMIGVVDLAMSNLQQVWMVSDEPTNISGYDSFLLSINGIKSEEIAISPVFATLYYEDYLNQLQTIRNAVQNPIAMNRRYVNALFEVFDHSINSYYASVLSDLSQFPPKSRVTYNDMASDWYYFPDYKIDEERSYYEGVVEREGRLAEEALSRFESVLEMQDAAIEELINQGDALEQMILEGYESVDASTLEPMAQAAVAELERVKQENEQELAIQRAKVETKRLTVEATQAELDELDKEYEKAYQDLRAKCTLEEEDDQWYKWGKIVRWGNFLNMVSESRRELEAQAIYSTSAITPEVAYADMRSLLSVYQTYHPDGEPYVAAAKQFFKEVSRGERDYAGVIIVAFQEGTEHSYFRLGDIVVGYNGKPLKTYADFKSAFAENDSATVKFIRLVGDEFQVLEQPIENTDIVGFSNLTE